MALPKRKHPIFKHKLVGLGKEVEYRAFTNNEQKILLLAKQSENKDEMLDSVIQVVEICTMGKINVRELSTFDIEDLFLRIRCKSISEISNIRYEHKYDEDGKPMSKFINVAINLDEVKVQTDPEHNKKIILDDGTGLIMKYPTFNMSSMSDDDVPMFCIDTIFTENETYNPAEYTEEELRDYFDDFDLKSLIKIKKFFDTMPILKHSVFIDLPDGEKKELIFEGLESFFS